jgi:hypothetical protein
VQQRSRSRASREADEDKDDQEHDELCDGQALFQEHFFGQDLNLAEQSSAFGIGLLSMYIEFEDCSLQVDVLPSLETFDLLPVAAVERAKHVRHAKFLSLLHACKDLAKHLSAVFDVAVAQRSIGFQRVEPSVDRSIDRLAPGLRCSNGTGNARKGCSSGSFLLAFHVCASRARRQLRRPDGRGSIWLCQ